MHTKIHATRSDSILWRGADVTADTSAGLRDLLDIVTDGPVTLTADMWMGQDQVPMPARIDDLSPRSQVLENGQDAAVWPALIGTDPAVIVPNTAAIAGFLKLMPDYDGVLCIVSDQTDWVRISAGEACYAQTDLTRSLCASQAAGTDDEGALRDGFDITNGRSSRLGAEMAVIAASAAVGASISDSHTLGLALGAEFSAAKAFWLGENVTVMADGPLASAYRLMLNYIGVVASEISLRQSVFAGLSIGYEL